MNPNPQFPNAPGGGGMPGVKPGMQPPNKENHNIIMGHVAQALNSQGPFSGWKAEVPLKVRAMNVWQMITSLRLIQPRIDIQNAANAALSFEQKAFMKANERSDYDRDCNEKLNHIKDTRQRQAAVGLNFNPQGAMMQNQMQGGFPQQMNRGMQSSPMPGQQQMAMGMNDPNQQVAMQQRQQQQSALLQQQQQQRAQQRPGNGGTIPDDLNNLSPQETDHVIRLASQMLAKTSQEDMEKIKLNLSNMSPEQRQYLARKNMDPMTYFFRSQALNQLRRHRRARMDMGRGNNPGMDPNGAMMGDPSMMNQRQLFQNMMNLQRNSGFSGSPGQGLEPNAFIGNVENIQGQQADGLRSQEAGQLVVPASSSQMNQPPFPNQQNMFPQQMGQNGQGMNNGGMNPQLFGQQQFQNGSNGAQDRMQFQAQQSQAQIQAQAQAQARAQAAAAQKAQIALSGHGGQANAQSQGHMTQSSPVMPMLNQPMAPGQMSPAQVPGGQPRPPSRQPNMGQHPTGLQGQPNMQGRPAIPPGLPQAVQEQLAQMTNEQLQGFFMNQRRAAMASNMARNGQQQPGSMQQGASRPGQGQAMFNGQMANNPAMRNGMNMPQGMNQTGLNQPQQIPGQGLTPQQRAQQQQQRQQELYKSQLLRAQNTGVDMTPEQTKEMDRAAFPPSLLNQNNNPAQVPKQIKTWGQLKQWVAANPQASIGVDPAKLMILQKLHFGHIIAARNGGDPNGQGQGMMSQPMQGPQGQMANNPNFVNGQMQGQGDMLPMRPITNSDVQMARQKLGQNSNNFSDDQIREILQNRQKQIFMQNMRQRQMNGGPGMPQAGQMAHAMPQPAAVPPPPPAAQPKQPAAQPPPATTEPQTSNTKASTGGPTKNAKSAKQSAKNSKVKVESNEEPRASAAPQQPQPAATPAAAAPAPRQMPQLSQEQLASMTPQQRSQFEAQVRRQQQAMRVAPINRVTAEENWNKNLPPHIMEVANDIAQNAPPIKPIQLTAEQKAGMSQQIMENLDVISRMDAVVVRGFVNSPGSEKHIRHLLAMRFQLMRQFKDSPEWALNENFTIQPEWLQGTIMFIRKIFQLMIMSVNKQRPNPNQVPQAPAAQPNPTNPNALNSSNLSALQKQEDALQNARRSSTQSGANAPPAPFGAPSPQGVPHAYGPGGLAPEKLKLPPPKKRKQSQAGPVLDSPVQSSAPPVPTAGYQRAMADAKNAAAALAGAFKCSVVECQHHFQGFPTQAALDKHVEESHQPEEEEVIDNPMQYYLDGVSVGLGLTTDGQQPKQPIDSAPVTNINTKLSAMASPAKQGIPTPVTAGNTPMARVASQLDVKAASPAMSAQHISPHQNANKNMKLSPGKQPGKRTLDELEGKDPWADVPMNLEKIHNTFEPIFAECNRQGQGFMDPYGPPGYDAFDEFMNTEMWQEQAADNTPDSRDTALAILTPTDDDPKAGPKDLPWYDWMPWDAESKKEAADWMQIPNDPSDEFLSALYNGPDAVRIDWSNLEQQQKEMNLENGGIAIAAL
ncbi:hypothetical protein N7456_003353 [Penicillium angulare]|uniref:Mediator complex subunit 15 KIX domain-containing protein n=1 Tax=Penicillium angulare TaxID=116970 RepID=A0A9W9KIJ9_9EURO|nr:hypothetical protein N7456_003353 [Penicillium angulare]